MSSPEKLAAIGRYQILAELGSGGMGTVYKGLQPSLNREVAIKILPRGFSSDAELLARFLRESAAIASLNHPHIIQIIDRGEEKGLYYFVMEFMDGPSLESLLKEGKLPAPRAVEIVCQVARALEFAHAHGVIHRDIKPSNILLNRNRAVAKLADFGIARLAAEGMDSTITQSQRSLGTMNYMSPEQRRDAGTVDRRSDIYSLGVVFYQMLTGELPLGSFRLPSHRDRRISPRIDGIIVKCLRARPEERYASAGELLKDLALERPREVPLKEELRSAFSRLTHRREGFDPSRGPALRRCLPWSAAALVLAAALWFLFRGTGGSPLPALPARGGSAAIQKKLAYVETMVRDGMASQALDELRKIVEENPDSSHAAEALFRAAQIREGMGNHDQAVADYLKLVSLYPKSSRAPQAAYQTAVIYQHRIKDREKAISALQRVVEGYPESAFAPRALFQLALLQKEPDSNFIEEIFSSSGAVSDQAAVLSLEKLTRDYPRCPEVAGALIELARIYGPERLNQLKKSNEALLSLRRRYPQTTFPVDYYLAVNYEALGDKKTARELYTKFLSTHPTGLEAREAQKRIEDR
jgi:serine/threonine protein kinase/TolA-binding protein